MDNAETILLKKFIANTCTREELQQIEQLLKAGVSEEMWLRVMEKPTAQQESNPLARQHIDKLYISIDEKISSSIPQSKQVSFIPSQKWILRFAASLLLIAVASVWVINKQNSMEQLILKEVSTQQQRQHVLTSDGSEIWINNQSSLYYPDQFENDLREIRLEGEAFFEVAKEENRPFIVSTQNLNVKVLGTSFNIKSFKEEDEIVITLATGKVEVEVEGQQQLIVPGEQLTYNKKLKTFSRIKINPEDIYAWRDGLLVFNSMRLVDIAKTMERAFDVKIEIEGEELKQKSITLKLKDENISIALEVLSFSAGFQYKITDSIIHIKPRQ